MEQHIEILARTPLPTSHGAFETIAFRCPSDPEATHLALVRGEVKGAEALPVRVHSECFTGEVLHSIKCDCRDQLDAAMEHVAEHGSGVIVYLRQEGRGIGLVDKLRAYALQENEGLDTVDANRRLGLPDDARSYEAAAEILRWLGVESVVLLTNNPAKVDGLAEAGVTVAGRIPVLAAKSDRARAYLSTKVARMGHLLTVDAPSGEKKAG